MVDKWMAGAFANAHGQFKAAAQRAGMSTRAYARRILSSKTATTHKKRQASLALRGMSAKKK